MAKGRAVAEADLARRKENRRSLGFARDDKKERVAERRGPLPRDRAVVGAVETSTTRHLHRQQAVCAKSKKSQPLGMTKERAMVP